MNDKYLLHRIPEVPFYKLKSLNMHMKSREDVQKYVPDIDTRIKRFTFCKNLLFV